MLKMLTDPLVLDKLFYFYIYEVSRPIVIWHRVEDHYIKVTPGNNRYIGVALRDEGIWLDAYMIADSKKVEFPQSDDFVLGNMIDRHKGRILERPDLFKSNNRMEYEWATKFCAVNFQWNQECPKVYFLKNKYTLEVDGSYHYLNEGKEDGLTVSVNETNGDIFLAIKKLFEIAYSDNNLNRKELNEDYRKNKLSWGSQRAL